MWDRTRGPSRLAWLVGRAAVALAVLLVLLAATSPAVVAVPARTAAAQDTGDPTTAPAGPSAGIPASSVGPPASEPAQGQPDLGRIDDPDARHRVNLLVGLLVGLAAVVLAVTVWFWRASRPLPAALEPLAVMSRRRFRHQTPDEREGDLHAVHVLKAASEPPPRAADLLRQARGEGG